MKLYRSVSDWEGLIDEFQLKGRWRVTNINKNFSLSSTLVQLLLVLLEFISTIRLPCFFALQLFHCSTFEFAAHHQTIKNKLLIRLKMCSKFNCAVVKQL